MSPYTMTPEEQEAIREEMKYWEDDSIEDRLDADLCAVMRIYAGIEEEETIWQQTRICE